MRLMTVIDFYCAVTCVAYKYPTGVLFCKIYNKVTFLCIFIFYFLMEYLFYLFTCPVNGNIKCQFINVCVCFPILWGRKSVCVCVHEIIFIFIILSYNVRLEWEWIFILSLVCGRSMTFVACWRNVILRNKITIVNRILCRILTEF